MYQTNKLTRESKTVLQILANEKHAYDTNSKHDMYIILILTAGRKTPNPVLGTLPLSDLA